MAADFNRDGKTDVAIVNYGEDNELFLSGPTNGTLTRHVLPAPVGDHSTSTSVNAADFNNDGHVDLFITNYISGDENVLLWGDGTGSFVVGVLANTGDISDPNFAADLSTCAVTHDFNNDGWIDIWVGNYVPRTDQTWGPRLFINDGKGAFGVKNGGPNGPFEASRPASVPIPVVGVTKFHGNGDAFMDLIVIIDGRKNMALIFDSGGEIMIEPVGAPEPHIHAINNVDLVSSDKNATSVVFGDFRGNNNNQSGMFWTLVKESNVQYNLGDGASVYSPPTTVGWSPETAKADTLCVVTADFDNDGQLDVFLGTDSDDVNTLMLSDTATTSGGGSGTPAPWTRFNGASMVSYRPPELSDAGGAVSDSSRQRRCKAAVAADFNGDGLVDLFLVNSGNVSNELYLNNFSEGKGFSMVAVNDTSVTAAKANFVATFTADDETAPGGTAAVAADVDGDGDLDLFVVNTGGGPSELHLNLFVERGSDVAAVSGRNAAFLFENAAASGRGGVVTGANSVLNATFLATSVVAADFDGDGDVDLYVTSRGKNKLFVNVDGRGDYRDAEVVKPGVGGGAATATRPQSSAMQAVAADFNNDGFVDLFLCNDPSGSGGADAGDNRNLILLNDGAGVFAVSANAGDAGGVSSGCYHAAAADVDKDGDVDLIAIPLESSITASSVQFLLNDGGGKFSNEGAASNLNPSTIGNVQGQTFRAVVIDDFDGDGFDDVYVGMMKKGAGTMDDRLFLATVGTRTQLT